MNPRRGKPLYADLEVGVPSGPFASPSAISSALSKRRGSGAASGFEVESADMRLRKLDGEVVVTASSGDLRAWDVKGEFSVESSSGDCRIDGFDGDGFAFHSSSGATWWPAASWPAT